MENENPANLFEMFAISTKKEVFEFKDGKTKLVPSKEPRHEFELLNSTVYDYETKEIVRIASLDNYEISFRNAMRLKVKSRDIKPFLNFHFEKSMNKQKFYDYVKYEHKGFFELSHDKKEAIKDWLNEIKNDVSTITKNENDVSGVDKDVSNENWFKVGLKFATGEIQSLYDKAYSPKEIQKKLFPDEKNKIYIEKLILATCSYFKSSYENDSKNIYNNYKKVKSINDYCINNNITRCEEFISKVDELNSKQHT